jgi:hypothetical protein
MTINIGYDTYKFWNCAKNKIEVSTDTLKKLNLPKTAKYAFKDYDSLLEIISTKHGISKEELYTNRSKTEGFN